MKKRQKKFPTVVHRPIIMGNWKMNLGLAAAAELARQIAKGAPPLAQDVDLVVCPSFAALERVRAMIGESPVALGAQDVFWEGEGNYTGEVSVNELQQLDAGYVIVGHSERRKHLGETNDMIQGKVSAVIRRGLSPILCVGETMAERQAGKHALTVEEQVKTAFASVRPPFRTQEIVVAYEPAWAIASGEPCDPAEARRMVELIYYVLLEIFPQSLLRDRFRICYGGSVTPKNIAQYVDREMIHGVLVGGASLKAEDFLGLAKAVLPNRSNAARQRQKR
jgi:triosephosphate isomerase